MQQFIEGNLWLLGLDYAEMRPRQPLLRGVIDFLLERFDGFHDLLELKSPHDQIVRARNPGGEAPPSPSGHALSPDLAQALAQVHVYRDFLTTYADATEGLLGLRHTRDPRLIIVIGKADPLPDHCKRVSRTGFCGDLGTRMLSWGEEILRCHVQTEEVPRGVARSRCPAGARE